MRVTVRLHPDCAFEIGDRTPDIRALVKQYVKAFMDYAGRHAGHMPGERQVEDDPPTFAWKDANWKVGYTIESSGRTTVTTIIEVRLLAGGGSS
jgi:hypothetical protein